MAEEDGSSPSASIWTSSTGERRLPGAWIAVPSRGGILLATVLITVALVSLLLPGAALRATRHSASRLAADAPCLNATPVPDDPLATFFLNFQRDRDRALLTSDVACLKAVSEGKELENLVGTVNALRTVGRRVRVRVLGFTIDLLQPLGGGLSAATTSILEDRTPLDADGRATGPSIVGSRAIIFRLRSLPSGSPGWVVQDETGASSLHAAWYECGPASRCAERMNDAMATHVFPISVW